MNTRRRAAFLTEILTLAIDCFNRFEPTFVHTTIIVWSSNFAKGKLWKYEIFFALHILRRKPTIPSKEIR